MRTFRRCEGDTVDATDSTVLIATKVDHSHELELVGSNDGIDWVLTQTHRIEQGERRSACWIGSKTPQSWRMYLVRPFDPPKSENEQLFR
jgi:hypothetical protein